MTGVVVERRENAMGDEAAVELCGREMIKRSEFTSLVYLQGESRTKVKVRLRGCLELLLEGT